MGTTFFCGHEPYNSGLTQFRTEKKAMKKNAQILLANHKFEGIIMKT